MRPRALLAGVCLLACQLAAQAGTLLDFSDDERARIASHGPWPPEPVRDASNRVDGQAAAITLGRQLFEDRRLSGQGQLACASCHRPQRGFQDGRRAAHHGRNTPGLLNVAQQRWFRWDGAADSLWAASLLPLMAADEIAATPDHVLRLFARDAALARRYRQLFGPPQADEQLLVNVAKALAAYQATLVSPRSAFDDFRDALLRGDQAAAARYPLAAQRGLKLFIGPARCSLCHAGPTFSNGEFADIGRPFFTRGGADPGRWGGLQQLLASPYNRLGAYSDAPAQGADAVATRHVLMAPRHFGEFKVPGLRSLPDTAPYFHDGSVATLAEVVEHYNHLDDSRLHADGERLLQALNLGPDQAADLVAFLESLGRPLAPGRSSR